MCSIFEHLDAQTTDVYIQGRFDGAYRRKSSRSSIGVSLEFVAPHLTLPLLDLGVEIAGENGYESEVLAACRAVEECSSLYAKIHQATFAKE